MQNGKSGHAHSNNQRARHLHEVWEGAPALAFTEVMTAMKKPGRRFEDPSGGYVWLTPAAVEALETNPHAILIALGRQNTDRLNYPYVEPAPRGMNKDAAIAYANRANKHLLRIRN